MSKDHSPSFSKVVVTAGSLLCLLASWALLFISILLLTDALNPWDTAPASALPPAGTLSRLLYDLFTTFPTAFLPAFVILGVSVGLFLKQVIPTRKFVPLAWRFAALNVGLVGVGAVATPFVWRLEPRLLEALGVSFDYGYSRYAVSILFWSVLLLVWFWLQFVPARRRDARQARKAS